MEISMDIMNIVNESGYYSVERYSKHRGLVVAAARRRFHEHDKLLTGHVLTTFSDYYYYDIAAMKYMDRQIQKHPMKEDEILDMKVYRKKFTQTYEEAQAVQKRDSSNCSEMQEVQEENAMLKKENEQLKEEIELLKKIIRNL